jgi:hypothetical protein
VVPENSRAVLLVVPAGHGEQGREGNRSNQSGHESIGPHPKLDVLAQKLAQRFGFTPPCTWNAPASLALSTRISETNYTVKRRLG